MALRFGIIGCGDIAANSFAPSLLASQQADLVAVCRRDLRSAQDFAHRFGGCAPYDSAEDLLADQRVDAVVIATPTDTHHCYTIAAAQHGKHVLCEKPMGRSAAECREMISACAHAGVTLAVAYRRRLFPQVIKALELIGSGRIGQVVCVRTHYSGWTEVNQGQWRLDPEIGGAMMEMAVHRLEVLLHFAGRPVMVSAMVETVIHDWPVDDSDAVLLKFADGKIGLHSTILTSKPRRDSAQIDGTDGRIIIDQLEFHVDHLRLETPDGVENVPVNPLTKPYFDLPMIEDLCEAIATGREPVCDGETACAVQEIVDAAFQSARENRHIVVG